MKKLLLLALAAIAVTLLHAQQSVGIGTTSPDPSAQLDVTSINKGFLMPRMTSAQRVAIGSPAPGLMVYETTTSSVWIYNGGWLQLGSGGTSLWTASGANIYNSNTGNVGIGIITPANKLHVAGSLSLESSGPDLQFRQAGVDKVYIQSVGNNLRMGTNSGNGTGKLVIRMDGTDRVYVDSIGQVGIGRSAPTYDLDINGNQRIHSTSTVYRSVLSLYANPYLATDPSGYGSTWISFFNFNSIGGGNYDYTSKYKIEFEGANSERLKLHHADHDNQLVLSKTGRIGINEVTPLEMLHVSGNGLLEATHPVLKLKTTSIAAATTEADIEFNGPSNNLASIRYTNSSLVMTARNGAFTDLVLKDGNVGIGTGTPSEKLQLLGGNMLMTSFNPMIQMQQGAVDKGFIQLNNDDIRIGTNSSNTNGKFIIRTDNTDQVFVDNNGNMGFNVSTPLARLQILNGSDVSSSSHGYLMLGSVTGLNMIFDNNEIMARNAGGTATMILQSDGGAVRIGNVTVPANYKFAVNGKMICEEVRIKLSANWPDYVFSDDYKLRPLKEVEKFINQNKHLPGIAPAAEIEKEGLELGDMQKKMMQKIEELTLYIIQQQKEIEQLKMQVQPKPVSK